MLASDHIPLTSIYVITLFCFEKYKPLEFIWNLILIVADLSPCPHRPHPVCPRLLWRWSCCGHGAEWPAVRCPSCWRTPRWHGVTHAGAWWRTADNSVGMQVSKQTHARRHAQIQVRDQYFYNINSRSHQANPEREKTPGNESCTGMLKPWNNFLSPYHFQTM